MSEKFGGAGRRSALKVLGSAGGLVGIQAFVGALSTRVFAAEGGTRVEMAYPRQLIGRVSALRPLQSERFEYPDGAAFNVLVRLSKSCPTGVGPGQDIVAYNTVCPHMGCPIEPEVEESGMLGPCRCHFSCFDLAHDGLLIQGQATESLPRIILEVHGDDIFAVGVSGLIYGRHDNLEPL